ncbi:MAG: hypothetical protein JXB04_10395 [Kiritimatiellae bacterium]|nr:hypothetical protein [Kiritimatiellia bacterium]
MKPTVNRPVKLSALLGCALVLLGAAPGLQADMSAQVFVSVWIDSDVDLDGMPDSWEMRWFNNLATANATTDFDKDQFPDLHECLAGTDPFDPLSLLIVTALDRLGTALRVTWQSSTEAVPHLRRYDIYTAAVLEDFDGGGEPLAVNVLTAGDETFIDDPAPGAGHRFYRVRLRP